ncbi:MAG: hypothetical protein HXX13_07425 [Bacteroidetes bacterium]|nr:hypothetical protein [Bacteroidota bacterium]
MSLRLSRLLLFLPFLTVFSLLQNSVFAQCCSTGSPVGASTYVGVLNKNSIRFTTFFRHSFSDVYYSGTAPSKDSLDMANNAHYSYQALSVEYGITHKLTAQFDMGYFYSKIVDFRNPILTDHNGKGLSNGLLMLKYGFYVNTARLIEFSGGLGLKFPFSRKPMTAPNGTLLQLDARPSTNAFGLTGTLMFSKEFSDITLRSFLLNRFEYNFSNINEYQSGPLMINSLFVSKRIIPRLFGILQVRNEIHGKDVQKGTEEVNTGYHLIVFTPQVSYSIMGKWSLSLLYDIPVYKNYQGKQLTPQYSYAISLARDLAL